MTEFVSHYNEGHHQISKSSSNASTSKKVANTFSDSRIFAQKIEGGGKSFTSNKEFEKKNLHTALGKQRMDEKTNLSLEGYKIMRKSDIRPSDSSYIRKLAWDYSATPTETSPLVHNSKSHSISDVKPGCNATTKILANNYKTHTYNHMKKNEKKVTHAHHSHRSEIERLFGVSPNTSFPYCCQYPPPKGNPHSEINQDPSKDSSHLQSHDSESNNLLSIYPKRFSDLHKKSLHSKMQSPVQTQNHKSPAANYVSNVNSKDSTASSQKLVPEEFFSRPNSSSWGDEENSNEEKSLAVNISNPVTNSLNTVTSTPEKTRSPYSIEMREGMFKTVKVGPEHETLKIHIIENSGSCDLRDGGFSWGWTIERRNSGLPSSKMPSATKDKHNSGANRDSHRSKRRLEFEKTSCSPTSKKPRIKVSDNRDIKSCKDSSSKVSVEEKEIKHKSNHVVPLKQSSSYIKPNSMHGEKSAKSLKFLQALLDAKKSMSDERNTSFDTHCEPAISPIEKRKSPIYVPSSEMIVHLPKTECLGKNKVIDDSTMGFISSKKERSAVYSGRKSTLDIQSLKVMCFEAVKKNILGLKIGQNVPFELLLPALKLCSPSKLHRVEEHNRHILRLTDCLWKKFCESEFRDQKRLNGEVWKDVYWRARNLREAKLKNLAASISNGLSKAHPERQAKWVGVGTNNPEKRQRKTKVEEVHKAETPKNEENPIPKPETNGRVSSSSSSHKQSSTKKRSESESPSSNSPQFSQKPTSLPKNQGPKTAKKTLAPLMSKTKKMLNFVNRRR